jgi:predicted molibdopterin-dependent oxidoreductase YjgC
MLDTMGTEGGVRALLVVASNIAVSAPRAGHIQERMDALDFLVVATRRGTADLKAAITPTICPDTLFVPFHWGDGSCANLLTNPALDPTSRMPEFKVCAARIDPRQ